MFLTLCLCTPCDFFSVISLRQSESIRTDSWSSALSLETNFLIQLCKQPSWDHFICVTVNKYSMMPQKMLTEMLLPSLKEGYRFSQFIMSCHFNVMLSSVNPNAFRFVPNRIFFFYFDTKTASKWSWTCNLCFYADDYLGSVPTAMLTDSVSESSG